MRPIPSDVHGLSVCESVVGHADVLWQNDWTDRNAVWHLGCGGRQSPDPDPHLIDGGPDPPREGAILGWRGAVP